MMTPNSVPAAILAIVRSRRADDRIGRLELVSALRRQGYFEELSDKTADRKMRAAIAELRTFTEEGARICSTSDGSGYWFGRTPEEIERAASDLLSRVTSITAAVRNMRREADRLRIEPLRQGELF